MLTVSIRNASVFNGHAVEIWPTFTFQASPGKIMSPQNFADNTIDGTDCTLIPGLIDAKIDAGAAPWVFPKFAAAGVTTVIDASSETADTQAMRRATSWTPGWPSYLAAGSAAGASVVPGLKGLHMFPFRSVETVSSPAEAEQFVSKHVSKYYPGDFVRVITDVPDLDDQTLQALVNAARRRGKLVVAHASQAWSYRRALSVGCEIITPVPIDGELDSEIIEGLRKNGVAVIPNLSLIRRVSALSGYPPSIYDNAVASVRALNGAKVLICAGTSANDSEGLAVNCGDGIYEELQLLLQAGLSNAEALRAATSVPAQAFRLSDRGSIEVGKRSDLVLLQGNPLDDLSAIRHGKKVWIDGVEFDDKIQGSGGVWTAEQGGRIARSE
ncbi:hypothetical protein ACHAQJ_007945 [Trichoderma viride]